jgi:hypothetical protein
MDQLAAWQRYLIAMHLAALWRASVYQRNRWRRWLPHAWHLLASA